MSTFYIKRNDDDLVHYGVLGMRWGVRRYQNPDGSLTKEGREKYLKGTTYARVKGSIWGQLLGGPLASLVLSQKAYEHQVKRNIEKDERNYEREIVSKMSDKDLSDFNYRKSLERQLSDILNKENELMGEDYVNNFIDSLKYGLNALKGVTDLTLAISTPTKEEKENNKRMEREQINLRIENLNNQRKAAITGLKEMANDPKFKDKLNTKEKMAAEIKKINSKFDSYINTEKEMSKKRIDNFNKTIWAKKLDTAVNQDRIRLNRHESTLREIARMYKRGVNIDTGNLSNKELQKIVDRARAEQQYLNIVTPVYTSSGSQYVNDIINETSNFVGTVSQELKWLKGLKG